jgi:hypothetical protein
MRAIAVSFAVLFTLIAAVPQNVQSYIAGDPHIPLMACSTTYGCQLRLPLGEQLENVVISDPRFQSTVLSTGATTAPVIKILPQLVDADTNSARPLSAEIDVLTNLREYRVALVATSDLMPASIQYSSAGRAAVVPIPHDQLNPATESSNAETAPIDPTTMDFGWRSESSTKNVACVAVFSVAPREQIWCKLPASIITAPTVTYQLGGATVDADVRLLQDNYLVVDTLASPINLAWPNGDKLTIIRNHQ